MLKSLKKKMKDQAGLTLIELLVVIVILGIIAAVAIPMVMSNRETAETNTNAQNLSIVQDAVNRYFTVKGSWPGAGAGADNAAISTALVPEFIDKLPACANGKAATYTLSASPANKVTRTCAN